MSGPQSETRELQGWTVNIYRTDVGQRDLEGGREGEVRGAGGLHGEFET